MNTRLIIGAGIVLIGISILFDLNLFRLIIPALLIWIGVQIIMGTDKTGINNGTIEAKEGFIKKVLILTGSQQSVTSEDFKGAEFVVICGGGEIDLSQVKTKEKKLQMELVAILGGLEITVPNNWIVTSQGIGVLGGFDNIANTGQGKKIVEVEIKGVAVLGGVVVKN